MRPSRSTCQITVCGACDERLADSLGGLRLCAQFRHEGMFITTLVGDLPDLAAFIGMMSMLADQGITVLGCQYHRRLLTQDSNAESAQR